MKRQRGATIVESALVLPVFFLLLLAIFEFGLVYSTYQTMAGAVREGARYAAATNANLASPSAAQVSQVVCNYIQTGVFGIGNISACSSGGTPSSLTSGTCPSSSSPPTGLTTENVYVGQCTVPVTLSKKCSPSCGNEVFQEVVVHRTVQLMWGWQIPLTAYAVMRSEAN
jgi:Flp pilus assembly protein TadG